MDYILSDVVEITLDYERKLQKIAAECTFKGFANMKFLEWGIIGKTPHGIAEIGIQIITFDLDMYSKGVDKPGDTCLKGVADIADELGGEMSHAIEILEARLQLGRKTFGEAGQVVALGTRFRKPDAPNHPVVATLDLAADSFTPEFYEGKWRKNTKFAISLN